MVLTGYKLANIVYDYAAAHQENDELTVLAEGGDDEGGNTFVRYIRGLLDGGNDDGQTEEMLERARNRVIDFAALQARNPEIIGWLSIPNTNIDYAITQTTNNDFYLHHSATRRRTSSGAIFLSAGLDPSFDNQNSVVFGHHMRDGSMFGSLPRLRNATFRTRHQNIFVYTPQATKSYQISTQFITNDNQLAPVESPVPLLTLVTCEYNPRNSHYVVKAQLTAVTAPGGGDR